MAKRRKGETTYQRYVRAVRIFKAQVSMACRCGVTKQVCVPVREAGASVANFLEHHASRKCEACTPEEAAEIRREKKERERGDEPC